MSNFQDQTDKAQNQNPNQEPDMDDPGMPNDALEPLSQEEKEQLKEETEELIHQQSGSHEGQAGQDELESKQGQGDYAEGGISNEDANQGIRGMDAETQDADLETNVGNTENESPTAGGASAGANTAGIGQGTTDFDEENVERPRD